MVRLLLISNSTQHGGDYLEHCAPAIQEFLGTAVRRVLFVPFAVGDQTGYAGATRERFERMGYGLDSAHDAPDPVAAVRAAEAIFVGGGNTFRLLDALYAKDLIGPIRERVAAGLPYLGASAGSNAACLTLKTTNDMPIVQPPSFDALGLVPFNLNPHYLDPDPASTHQGETREKRIAEFHEVNTAPVVGLREGAMLRVEGSTMRLLGINGVRLFRRGQPPEEFRTGAELDFLLAPREG
jgi:dipeptidase E